MQISRFCPESEKIAQSHDRETVTFRNSDPTVKRVVNVQHCKEGCIGQIYIAMCCTALYTCTECCTGQFSTIQMFVQYIVLYSTEGCAGHFSSVHWGNDVGARPDWNSGQAMTEPLDSLPVTSTVLYTVHCTLYSVHCIVYTVHCTLYTVKCKMYTVHCTLYTIHCTQYTHCRLLSGVWWVVHDQGP